MKEIIDRIERLEELAFLTHGTLDVDQVEANLKELIEEDRKRMKRTIDYVRSQIKARN